MLNEQMEELSCKPCLELLSQMFQNKECTSVYVPALPLRPNCTLQTLQEMHQMEELHFVIKDSSYASDTHLREYHMRNPLQQWFSKHGSLTISLSITWGLTKM